MVNLANDSQLAKMLPNHNLPLKYLECRAVLFITAKSLVSKYFIPSIFRHIQYSILCLYFMLSCFLKHVYHA